MVRVRQDIPLLITRKQIVPVIFILLANLKANSRALPQSVAYLNTIATVSMSAMENIDLKDTSTVDPRRSGVVMLPWESVNVFK